MAGWPMPGIIRRPVGWLLAGLFCAAAPLAAQSPARATPDTAGQPSSLLLRVVSDSAGSPLAGVSVQIEGAKKLRAVTDPQGYARLQDIPPGWQAIAVDMLGYSPLTMSVDFEPGKQMALRFALTPQPIILRALEIRAEVRKRWLSNTGFYDRRKSGLGTFVADDKLEATAERASRLSDMLRGMRGLRVVTDSRGNVHLVSSRGNGSLQGQCTPRIYLDGMPADWLNDQGGDLDSLVYPSDVAAIEIYAGPSELPAQYGGLGAACGAVLLWTKR